MTHIPQNHWEMKLTLMKKKTFLFRIFTAQGSSRKTFHEGSTDNEFQYDQVWRLAPRIEFLQPFRPVLARVGQTLRVDYEGTMITLQVSRVTSKHVYGIIECGKNRGNSCKLEKIEMQDCQEIFASSLLQTLHTNLSSLE